MEPALPVGTPVMTVGSSGASTGDTASGDVSFIIFISGIYYSYPDEDELNREERESPVRVAVSGVAAASHTIIMEDHEEEEKGEGQNTELLAIPAASVTNSSSAETLTDNTLTEPETR